MADLKIVNARIVTMDPACPETDAILIRGGKIAALGEGARQADAKTLDAQGHLILPGFQDAHTHLLNGGTDLVVAAQLYDATTITDLQTTLHTHAQNWPGPILWGSGWQSGFFNDYNLTRDTLDPVTGTRPCLIYDGNFHNACLNSAAIALIGITNTTPDPMNGHIVRDATGRATGMLHEEAIAWAEQFLPDEPDETLTQGLLAGQSHANRHGITGIIDPCILPHHARTYQANLHALTLRVAGAALISARDTPKSALKRLTALRKAHNSSDFHINAAKFFMDGGFENRTAALLEPYADAAAGNAPLMFTPDQIANLFTALDAARFQIHVHCIGDAATRATLDGIEHARTTNGAWPALHQIAHVQLVHPDDLPRFAALGVIGNMQPLWAAHDPVIPDDTMAMIGPARAGHTYAFRSLIDAGASYCINSDWAVTTLNPFEIIGTAVTREPPRHRGRADPFLPEQHMTREQALLGYTRNAAAACWRGNYTGQLSPGYSADLIVLDRDILTCDAYAIAETQVLLTLFKGQTVWQSHGFSHVS